MQTDEDKMSRFCRFLIQWQINKQSDCCLFRANSQPILFLGEYVYFVGQNFLQHTLAAPLGNLIDQDLAIEVNPNRVETSQDLIDNQYRLEAVVQTILDNLITNVNELPTEICSLGAYLHTTLKLKSQKVADVALSNFLFLRFICPAIVIPHKYGVVPMKPEAKVQRSLILVTKILQSLASFSPYAEKEKYMMVFNEFLERNQTKMKLFFSKVCSRSQSNSLSPRYSSESNTSNIAIMSDEIEKSLQAIRVEILSKAEEISSRILDNEIDEDGECTCLESCSCKKNQLSLTPNSMKLSFFRRLFSRKKNDKTFEKSETICLDSATPNAGHTETAVLVDVAEKIGSAHHKKNRLMRLYYSKIAYNSCQYFLKTCLQYEDCSNNKWKFWKEINSLRIYKKRVKKNGISLTELLGSIEISVSAESVFSYLCSLRNIWQLDDAVDMSREVEILDNRQSIMYHSLTGDYLSRIFTIQSRDTCDLVTFHRNIPNCESNTFAITAQPVLRSDVPPIQGNRRMYGYSTGYILQSLTSTTSKITCITSFRQKNFFSKYSHRFLHSRQILSVNSIKNLVEQL